VLSSCGERPTTNRERLELLLADAVREHRDRPALELGERQLTYAALDAAAERLAARMTAKIGDRIAIIAPNVPALAVALLAGWRRDAVVIPLSARLRGYELNAILRDAAPVEVVTVSDHRGQSFVELVARNATRVRSLRGSFAVDANGAVMDEVRWDANRDDAEQLPPEIGLILYTSGTTGEPKGALVPHARETRAAAALGAILELERQDRSAQAIPIAHAFGLTCMLACLGAGACVVLTESSFSPRRLLAVARAGAVTLLHGSPAVWISLLKAVPRGFPQIRRGLVGGSPVPSDLVESLERLGTRLLNVYGMTEIGAASCCRLDDPPEVRYTTSGAPLAGYELRIAADGELLVRGGSVTPGYLGRPNATAESFVDGWFRTGDLASIDEAGNLRITGRAKEVVDVAGFSVFPAEVEGFLLTHPDVAQAAVVGVAHETMGEVLQAFVVPRTGSGLDPPELVRYARGKIADYKLPYGVLVVSELPTLASGKPDRTALRRLAAEARMGTDGKAGYDRARGA
jgi:acyl-CoA synthetase (AMP-forming)/AMP-acid ligase II